MGILNIAKIGDVNLRAAGDLCLKIAWILRWLGLYHCLTGSPNIAVLPRAC